jgi:Holliday junction resolvase
MTNWSKVGRRSRRKGKKFECNVAKMLRDVTGLDWQSTRNSGRTDLPGDIYCLDRECIAVIECKDRPTQMTTRDVIRGNVGYKKQMEQVIERFKGQNWRMYKMLVVFRKDEYGIWVFTYAAPAFFNHTALVKGPDQRRWRLLGDFTDGVLRLLANPGGEGQGG